MALVDFLPDMGGESQRRLGGPLSDSELVEREGLPGVGGHESPGNLGKCR